MSEDVNLTSIMKMTGYDWFLKRTIGDHQIGEYFQKVGRNLGQVSKEEYIKDD